MSLRQEDLYGKHDQLIELKRQTYETLYKRCVNIIKLTAATGELMCIFEVPRFMFGVPYALINQEMCANYIINKLSQTNRHIKCLFVTPNYIIIDWRRNEDFT
jgi:hypothetical protein